MRPTWPLLALTLLQGMAGGIFSILAVLVFVPGFPQTTLAQLAWAGVLVALAGGFSSFFHMHRIQAARFIFRRLKTSWLSREALTTGIFVAAAGVTALSLSTTQHQAMSQGIAVLSATLGLLAMFVTAMLYGTIPAMKSWHSPLTVLSFTATGLLTGLASSLALLALEPLTRRFLVPLTVAEVFLTVVLFLIKVSQQRWFRAVRQNLQASTGTGMPLGPYRVQDTGTTRPPYRTQTQIWPELPVDKRRGQYLRMFVFLTMLPIGMELLWILVPVSSLVIVAGTLSLWAGAYMERWLFFADATHSSRVWFADQTRAPSRVTERAMVGLPAYQHARASVLHEQATGMEND